ncbi:MAG: carbohydrate kinase [Sedimentisphaeraceae bacterium JB056]
MNNGKIKVLSFGEVLFDVINGKEHLGGASMNFAAHLSRLGVEAYILSACGNDERGSIARRQIKDLGISLDFLNTTNGYQTGIVDVQLQNGQPSYDIVQDVAYDHIVYSKEQLADMASIGADAFYFGSLAQRNEVSRSTLHEILDAFEGRCVFYDVNLRQDYYSKELIEKSFSYTTILKINDEELPVISELLFEVKLSEADFYSKISSLYSIELLVVTKGGEGCSVFWPQSSEHIAPVKVKVADAVGAGDSFSAAFVYNYLSGIAAGKAAHLANKLGAFVASRNGAIPDYNPKEIFSE